jgi:holliday junction DNA helicase RuvA
MIGYLKGKVAGIYDENIVLEVNSIGYNVKMPASTITYLNGIGEEVKLYTYLAVREDALLLYGFLTKDDLDFFKLLIQVNGIGPKGALSILSVMTTADLRFAILSADVKTISKTPGIGAKTAQRLIIDLKDKVSLDDAFEERLAHNGENNMEDVDNIIKKEAIEALTALGYSASDSLRAVKSVSILENANVEMVLKQALKNINHL